MLKQQPPQRLPGQRWQPSTAQILIFIMIPVCGLIIYNSYQMAHEPPPPFKKILVTGNTPRQIRYKVQIEAWRKQLTAQEMTLTWPYLGQNNVARIDLPRKTPISLQDWDSTSEAKAASDAYDGFVAARKKAQLPPSDSPSICIVHLFDVDGNEVAQASASGIATT